MVAERAVLRACQDSLEATADRLEGAVSEVERNALAAAKEVSADVDVLKADVHALTGRQTSAGVEAEAIRQIGVHAQDGVARLQELHSAAWSSMQERDAEHKRLLRVGRETTQAEMAALDDRVLLVQTSIQRLEQGLLARCAEAERVTSVRCEDLEQRLPGRVKLLIEPLREHAAVELRRSKREQEESWRAALEAVESRIAASIGGADESCTKRIGALKELLLGGLGGEDDASALAVGRRIASLEAAVEGNRSHARDADSVLRTAMHEQGKALEDRLDAQNGKLQLELQTLGQQQAGRVAVLEEARDALAVKLDTSIHEVREVSLKTQEVKVQMAACQAEQSKLARTCEEAGAAQRSLEQRLAGLEGRHGEAPPSLVSDVQSLRTELRGVSETVSRMESGHTSLMDNQLELNKAVDAKVTALSEKAVTLSGSMESQREYLETMVRAHEEQAAAADKKLEGMQASFKRDLDTEIEDRRSAVNALLAAGRLRDDRAALIKDQTQAVEKKLEEALSSFKRDLDCEIEERRAAQSPLLPAGKQALQPKLDEHAEPAQSAQCVEPSTIADFGAADDSAPPTQQTAADLAEE